MHGSSQFVMPGMYVERDGKLYKILQYRQKVLEDGDEQAWQVQQVFKFFTKGEISYLPWDEAVWVDWFKEK